jgi:hypothetical protein
MNFKILNLKIVEIDTWQSDIEMTFRVRIGRCFSLPGRTSEELQQNCSRKEQGEESVLQNNPL